ncbi:hypothetical protein [Deinococcus sedimenti]|uniref:Lipoprotein n=1 Tax=Deinococcus sedimenti TaxID=1867090 RepID=A0ABQ2S1T0_9DEIO|nr:hypothetical protein [Deinococcus sedimenti]GGR77853.1 hypothetical protein GCM10008960_00710 [Deinococcus sedimenti]
MRVLLSALLLSLTACAPSVTTASRPDDGLRAAFSEAGVAWVAAGRACVARAPSFQVSCPAVPRAADVAWQAGQAWAGVPSLGVIVTLDGAPRTVTVGRVAALSAGRVYRENGTAVDYAGTPAAGVLGTPAAALTGGDGQEYVLLDGRVVRVADGWALPGAAFTVLNWRADGVQGDQQSQVEIPAGTYRLTGDHLERRDAAGVLRGRVPHPPGRLGMVGAWLVTVDARGAVRVFTPDLAAR